MAFTVRDGTDLGLLAEMAGSRGAVGEKDGDAIDDGVAARTSGAAHSVRIQHKRLSADRAGQPIEVFGLRRFSIDHQLLFRSLRVAPAYR